MAKTATPVDGARSTIVRLGFVASFAAALVVGAAPLASASGQSANLNNCYSTWGSTGTSAHCYNTSDAGYYQNEAYCGGVDYDRASGWTYIGKGSTISNWGQLNCTWSIRYSDVWFKY
ncbi:hypothetical protein [Streptomyces sp. CBMA156]|uniref:hypothetical protein n=1 Tax=Streptomyces sp. CBMA156 TaxID=1930280 RepID=UPI001661D0BF|nr:hypothetical protein [Streptomyces sp. CBMA156]MBD0672208.1 hypothetical protein [Streptomyces sp. CBMA156]